MFPAIAHGQHGRYRVDTATRRTGGQAEVYRAISSAGQQCALKVARSAETSPRLEQERRHLQEVHERTGHTATWLVPLLDWGTTEDLREFLVLPWFENNLESWLQSGPDLAHRLVAAEQAASALVHLHHSHPDPARVLLHRDIKPDNFLLEDRGDSLWVVLADLGGAREVDFGGSMHLTGLHTPLFASPEQRLPLTLPPDPSLDVHGLAATVYRCLAGQPPRSVRGRQGHTLEPAWELQQLHSQVAQLNPEQRQRYESLRRQPLDTFLDLDSVSALLPADKQLLRSEIEAELPEDADLASQLAELLLPEIEHGLHPDPRLREADPRRLLGALRSAMELLSQHQELPAAHSARSTSPERRRGLPFWLWSLPVPALALLGLGGMWMSQGMAWPSAPPSPQPTSPPAEATGAVVSPPPSSQEPEERLPGEPLAKESAPSQDAPPPEPAPPSEPALSPKPAPPQEVASPVSAPVTLPPGTSSEAAPLRVALRAERTANISVLLTGEPILDAPGETELRAGRYHLKVRVTGYPSCEAFVVVEEAEGGWWVREEGAGTEEVRFVPSEERLQLVCAASGELILS